MSWKPLLEVPGPRRRSADAPQIVDSHAHVAPLRAGPGQSSNKVTKAGSIDVPRLDRDLRHAHTGSVRVFGRSCCHRPRCCATRNDHKARHKSKFPTHQTPVFPCSPVWVSESYIAENLPRTTTMDSGVVLRHPISDVEPSK